MSIHTAYTLKDEDGDDIFEVEPAYTDEACLVITVFGEADSYIYLNYDQAVDLTKIVLAAANREPLA